LDLKTGIYNTSLPYFVTNRQPINVSDGLKYWGTIHNARITPSDAFIEAWHSREITS
jgi:hypothetical protein